MFLQDWGSYGNHTLVSVGMTYDEIIKESKKRKLPKKVIEEMEESELEVAIGDHNYGCVWQANTGDTFLWLRSFTSETWVEHDTLVHEVLHLVQYVIMEDKGMAKEWEAQAYQQEYLVKEIRSKIGSNKYKL